VKEKEKETIGRKSERDRGRGNKKQKEMSEGVEDMK